MEAVKFPTRITKDKKIFIPDEYFSKFVPEQEVQIIILYDKNSYDEKYWESTSVREFLNGYNDKDSIYDTLK